jgi:GlcNAc-PI de-N-acetylase
VPRRAVGAGPTSGPLTGGCSDTSGCGRSGPGRQAAPTVGDARPGRLLPAWSRVLAVVAHPDDETFGLGALVDLMAATGAAVHILCNTHGEASTLNENRADLHRERAAERRRLRLQGECEHLRWLQPAVA